MPFLSSPQEKRLEPLMRDHQVFRRKDERLNEQDVDLHTKIQVMNIASLTCNQFASLMVIGAAECCDLRPVGLAAAIGAISIFFGYKAREMCLERSYLLQRRSENVKKFRERLSDILANDLTARLHAEKLGMGSYREL
jgi:hypothetical protein